MKTMMRLVKMGVAGCVLAAVYQASAITTPLDITFHAGALVVAAPKGDIGNVGDATVLAWITQDIHSYNALEGTSLADPIGTLVNAGGSGNSFQLAITPNDDYLFLHWGGSGGGWIQAFYVGGLSGTFTFDNSAIPGAGGLSGYRLYDAPPGDVPDGGITALLLGAALSALGLIRRKLS